MAKEQSNLNFIRTTLGRIWIRDVFLDGGIRIRIRVFFFLKVGFGSIFFSEVGSGENPPGSTTLPLTISFSFYCSVLYYSVSPQRRGYIVFFRIFTFTFFYRLIEKWRAILVCYPLCHDFGCDRIFIDGKTLSTVEMSI